MSQPLPVAPIEDITVLIFGASGDLTSRKLIPALYRLYKDGFLSDRSLVIGVARRPKSDESFRAELLAAAEELRFEYAAKLRDEIKDLRRELLAHAVS